MTTFAPHRATLESFVDCVNRGPPCFLYIFEVSQQIRGDDRFKTFSAAVYVKHVFEARLPEEGVDPADFRTGVCAENDRDELSD